MTIDPPVEFRVLKGMVVDMEASLPRVSDAQVPADGRERRPSVDDRERFDGVHPCAACTTSCPSFRADENFVAPRPS